jgi:hydrogenase-1 operon protein HyaF
VGTASVRGDTDVRTGFIQRFGGESMSGLDSISIKVEEAGGQDFRTENLRPLMRQVEQALADLVESQRETVIDLAAMPFSDQDEAELRAFLGTGEVSAVVDAFGPSRIEETGVPGVWLVEHRDAEDRRLTLHIAITRVPALLVTPTEDLTDGLRALRDRRATGDSR